MLFPHDNSTNFLNSISFFMTLDIMTDTKLKDCKRKRSL